MVTLRILPLPVTPNPWSRTASLKAIRRGSTLKYSISWYESPAHYIRVQTVPEIPLADSWSLVTKDSQTNKVIANTDVSWAGFASEDRLNTSDDIIFPSLVLITTAKHPAVVVNLLIHFMLAIRSTRGRRIPTKLADHRKSQGRILRPRPQPITNLYHPNSFSTPVHKAQSTTQPYQERRGRAHHHQVVFYLFWESSYLPRNPRVQHTHVVRRHERVLFCRHLFRTAILRALLTGSCVIAPADRRSHGHDRDAFVYSDMHMNGMRPTEVHERSQQGRSRAVYLAIEVCKVSLQIFFHDLSSELSHPETFDALLDNLPRWDIRTVYLAQPRIPTSREYRHWQAPHPVPCRHFFTSATSAMHRLFPGWCPLNQGSFPWC